MALLFANPVISKAQPRVNFKPITSFKRSRSSAPSKATKPGLLRLFGCPKAFQAKAKILGVAVEMSAHVFSFVMSFIAHKAPLITVILASSRCPVLSTHSGGGGQECFCSLNRQCRRPQSGLLKKRKKKKLVSFFFGFSSRYVVGPKQNGTERVGRGKKRTKEK